MKNIHVLPTDKPSRLAYETIKDGNDFAYILKLFKKPHIDNRSNSTQNIYITSDEEINFDEYYLGDDNNIYCLVSTVNFNGKKIILTTDQDLIKDGVQAIDDDFLEWFVKNPSCEKVEVIEQELNTDYRSDWEQKFYYKIIIPKEEQKQHLIDIMKADEELGLYEEPKQITSLDGDDLGGIPKGILTMLIGEKEETLEEFAEREASEFYEKGTVDWNKFRQLIEVGAKWQQKRMYSEQEAFNLLMEFSSRDRNSSSGTPHSIAKWFEQFKKK